MNKKNTFVVIGLLVIIIGLITYILVDVDSDDRMEAESANAAEDDRPQPVTDNSQFAAPEDVEQPAEDEPMKEPIGSVVVSEKPIVYTGFGNSESRPLELDQTTSTTCETDPGVACSVSFRNTESGEVVSFEPQTTEANGVTRWEWQGSAVGSGTWEVTATAGDKSSDTGILYIQ